jgi:type IV pilus assembly protein PilM
MASRILGLDIGRDTIRAVEVENAEKARPVAVRYAEAPLPPEAVRSGEVREINTVAAAIRRLWTTGGFKTKNVVLGMGNQRVLARDLTVPKMGIVQIRESLPFQVQELLPVPVADALLDFYPVSEGVGENGPVIHGLLVAAIKESVMANVNAVRQAGLHPVHVDLIPFALTRILVNGSLARGTVALIDIGASTTNVVITTAGVPQFVRMIPAGGEDITRALVNSLEISPPQAEGLKRQRGLAPVVGGTDGDARAAAVIRESTNELLGSLRNTVNYFSNTRQNEPIQAIVLSGGGARLNGLPQALGELTHISVIPADPFASIELSKTLQRKGIGPESSMAVSLGLALGATA